MFHTTTALGLLALPGSALDTLRGLLPDGVIGGSGPSAVDEETMNSYRTALRAVLDEDDQQAVESFRAVWERREEIGSEGDGLDVVLPAGVGLAATLRIQGERPDDADPKRILGLVEPHWERLTPPIVTLFETLSERYPDANEDDIPAVGGAAPEGLEELETAAFAHLLDRFFDRDHDTTELYRGSLQAIMHHRAKMAVELQSETWNRWDQDAEEPEDEILGAGIALAGHLEFLDEVDLDVSRDEIISAVEPYEDRLSVAPAALFERLSTGSTDTDPERIVEEHVDVAPEEFDGETADLADLESLAISNLLQTLRDRADEDSE